MSHANRQFVVAYIFLVGIPLLGLGAVLKSGRALAAPASVDGVWKVEAASRPASALPCGNSLALLSNGPLVISQSGKTLVLTLSGGSKATVPGAIEGSVIRASIAPGNLSSEEGCDGDRTFNLTATLDLKSDPRTMSGRLTIEGCSSCMPIEFRAAKQPRGEEARR